MTVVLTLAALLFAGAATADEGPALTPRNTARRPYPSKIYDDRSVTRRCVLDVSIDRFGRVESTTAVDCPEELLAFGERIARRDTWKRPVPDGATARIDLEFVPPIDAFLFPHPDTWRFRGAVVCDTHLAIGHDGQVRVRSATEGCGLELEDDLRVGEAPWGERARVVPLLCPVSLRTVGGRRVDVQVFRCPPSTWAHAKAVVEALPLPDGHRVWALVLGFGGAAAE